MDTKAVNLGYDEIKNLIVQHGYSLNDEDDGMGMSDRIERINYLNKRLKEFSKPAKPIVDTATYTPNVPVDGWSSNNGA